MATKSRIVYQCQQCGARAPKWQGRCPDCGEWNTYVETVEAPVARRPGSPPDSARPRRVSEIPVADLQRLPVPLPEVSRVLGGGIVPGSLVLVGGDPGVGKSTLLMQLSEALAAQGQPVLYVSGEESLGQIGLRARRLGHRAEQLYYLCETDLARITEATTRLAAALLIVDSIQSVYDPELPAAPGSVGQLRECTLKLMRLAKTTGTAVFLVGHVTKEGVIAGPKVLEHMVDCVLYLEGERLQAYRLLRGVKNRFGSTHEVGVFEMRGEGLVEISNPSQAFLAERVEGASGSAVAVTLEGTRPLLLEVQALVSRSALAVPRRTSNGIDANRLLLVSAVLAKRLNVPLYDQDIYVNVIGGLRVEEPAADLAMALAILSSYQDTPLDSQLVVIGEVGLSGEIRGVAQLERRLREAAQLGFTRALVPRSPGALPHEVGLEVLTARTLREAALVLGPPSVLSGRRAAGPARPAGAEER
ncbi:MAG TPA: DNA repair protein RadA [Chloroflexota bacterium]|nr:DNA repair protein RadA [Chloroflexota bacterium]